MWSNGWKGQAPRSADSDAAVILQGAADGATTPANPFQTGAGPNQATTFQQTIQNAPKAPPKAKKFVADPYPEYNPTIEDVVAKNNQWLQAGGYPKKDYQDPRVQKEQWVLTNAPRQHPDTAPPVEGETPSERAQRLAWDPAAGINTAPIFKEASREAWEAMSPAQQGLARWNGALAQAQQLDSTQSNDNPDAGYLSAEANVFGENAGQFIPNQVALLDAYGLEGIDTQGLSAQDFAKAGADGYISNENLRKFGQGTAEDQALYDAVALGTSNLEQLFDAGKAVSSAEGSLPQNVLDNAGWKNLSFNQQVGTYLDSALKGMGVSSRWGQTGDDAMTNLFTTGDVDADAKMQTDFEGIFETVIDPSTVGDYNYSDVLDAVNAGGYSADAWNAWEADRIKSFQSRMQSDPSVRLGSNPGGNYFTVDEYTKWKAGQ